MTKRNITLSLPEDLVRRAKVLATQQGTSVSALVAHLLEQAVGGGNDYESIWAAEERLMQTGIGLEVGQVLPTRDEVHEL
ncbi:MAG: hypothetical protein H3C53_08595 [Trueperaceae bacterium]|nr:hypothetical protein [Trueperaceae bacterium]